MVSNGRIKALGIVIALLLALTSVQAVGSTDASSTVCASDTALFVLPLTNHGANSDSYTISLVGDGAKWAVAAPSGFVLKPGQSNSVYIYVTPSLAAQPGTYSLDAIVNSGLSGKTITNYKVVVDDCHASVLTAESSSLNACACTPGKYYLTLENTGRYSETFAIKVSGAGAQYATPNPSEVRLGPNERRDVEVSVMTPCSAVGDYDLTVSAVSKESNAVANVPLVLKSEACYNFDFVPDKTYLSFCENAQAKIPLNIQNKGIVDNNYYLKVTGPSWASLESTSAQAMAGKLAVVNLILFPRLGTAGDFKVNVEATSARGEQKVSREIVANVLQCYAANVKILAEQDTICPGTEKAYSVQVSNLGKYDSDFVLSTSGTGFASLDATSVKLKAGESATVNLIASPKDTEPADYAVKVLAEQAGVVSASDQLVLKVLPRNSCFGVRTTPAEQQVNVARGQGALIPVVVENLGRESATYNLDVSGSGAAYAKLNPSTLTLGGSEAGTAYAYVAVPADAPQQNYKLTVSARLQDGAVYSSSTISISVAESKPEVKPAMPEKPKVEHTLPDFSAQTQSIKGFFAGLPAKAGALIRLVRHTGASVVSSSHNIELPKITLAKPALHLPEKVSGAVDMVKTIDVRARNKANSVVGPYTEAVKQPLRQARNLFRNLIHSKTFGYKNWQLGIAVVLVLATILAVARSWPKNGKPAAPAQAARQPPVQPVHEQAPSVKPAAVQQKRMWRRFVDWLEEEDKDFLEGEKKPEDKI